MSIANTLIFLKEVLNLNLLDRVQQLASLKGLSIAEIERKANLGNGTIRRWTNSIPSADKLYRVSKVLGVSIEYLLSGEEPIENEKSKLIARKASSLSTEQLDAVLNMIDVFKSK